MRYFRVPRPPRKKQVRAFWSAGARWETVVNFDLVISVPVLSYLDDLQKMWLEIAA